MGVVAAACAAAEADAHFIGKHARYLCRNRLKSLSACPVRLAGRDVNVNGGAAARSDVHREIAVVERRKRVIHVILVQVIGLILLEPKVYGGKEDLARL